MNELEKSFAHELYDAEFNFRELFGVLWAGKWLIGGITFASILIAAIFALMQPNIYRAEALLAPSKDDGAAGLSALAAQYGGLASLAGINLGGGQADRTALGLEILKSRKFISEFIVRHDILVPLMAAEDWDAETGELRIDAKVYDLAADKWVRGLESPRIAGPSLQRAQKAFLKILSVSQDKSGFIKVAVEHYSPIIAKQWVDWLVEDINSTIMSQDVAEAEQAIDYLNDQVAKTSLADLQNIFFRLIEEQTKTVMLAKVSSEYLFKTLDPALVPEVKAKPKRARIVIFAALLGCFFGVVVQFVRSNNESPKQSAGE